VELFLDPDDPRPQKVQLYEQLRTAIVEGRLATGDRLVPSRVMAADLHISRATVTEAYGRLSAEGYIEGRSGGGSVVSAAPRQVRPRVGVAALDPTRRCADISPYDRDPTAEALFDFRPGRLDLALFPVAAWRRCVLRTLNRAPGQYDDPRGTPQLRAALANWVARSRGVAATPEDTFVTSGAGHAIDLVARVLADPGAAVAVEEPGYPPAVSVFRSRGPRVVGVPVDEHGIVVESIPPRARLVYVTPTHQFPLGMVMDRRRRLELLHWAARSGAAMSKTTTTASSATPPDRSNRCSSSTGTVGSSTSVPSARACPRPCTSASSSRPTPCCRLLAPPARPSTGAHRRRPRKPSPSSSSTATWTSTCGGPGAPTRSAAG
jgi:GntR family transcriptional regulator/MocR family aminotransferase